MPTSGPQFIEIVVKAATTGEVIQRISMPWDDDPHTAGRRTRPWRHMKAISRRLRQFEEGLGVHAATGWCSSFFALPVAPHFRNAAQCGGRRRPLSSPRCYVRAEAVAMEKVKENSLNGSDRIYNRWRPGSQNGNPSVVRR